MTSLQMNTRGLSTRAHFNLALGTLGLAKRTKMATQLLPSLIDLASMRLASGGAAVSMLPSATCS